jgi:phosphoribosylanthranilate isomerase
MRRGLQPRLIAAADTQGAELADHMLRTAGPGRYGGTGLSATSTRRRSRRERTPGAGRGLRPGNVRAAIDRVRPFAVDVSGGGARTGVKDPDLLRRVLPRRHADHTGGTPQ